MDNVVLILIRNLFFLNSNACNDKLCAFQLFAINQRSQFIIKLLLLLLLNRFESEGIMIYVQCNYY